MSSSEYSRRLLNLVALFLGELRDGLTMVGRSLLFLLSKKFTHFNKNFGRLRQINMQSAFLLTSKGYTEKQCGVLFFVFGEYVGLDYNQSIFYILWELCSKEVILFY